MARYGWIRVLCDSEATPERVGRIQHELHQRGYYIGDANGRYDAETAAAIGRFQAERRIAHGGYLSLETLEALEDHAAEPAFDGSYAGAEAYGAYSSSDGYPSSSAYAAYGYAYGSAGTAYPPSFYAQPGYGPPPAYAARPSAIQNGWLTWSGKSEF